MRPTVVKAGTRPLCETWNQVRKRGEESGRGRTVGGERERGKGGEEKIELCFRDSLFLARKKAQTRVACPPVVRQEEEREEERRKREFSIDGMETFCGRQNERIGERNTFCPEHRPTNAFFPRPPHRARGRQK